MTEITVKTDPARQAHARVIAHPRGNFWMPKARPARYLVDPVAFLVALIGGPLLVTFATFWLLFLPVGALIVGGPVYLVFGTPLLLIHLRNRPGSTNSIVQLALLAVSGLSFGGGIMAFALYGSDAFWPIAATAALALVFAPAWASAFGWIYFKLRRELYARPLPTHF